MTWKATVFHGNADDENIVVSTGHRNRVTARAWVKEYEDERHALNPKASVLSPGKFSHASDSWEQFGTDDHYALIEMEPEEDHEAEA